MRPASELAMTELGAATATGTEMATGAEGAAALDGGAGLVGSDRALGAAFQTMASEDGYFIVHGSSKSF